MTVDPFKAAYRAYFTLEQWQVGWAAIGVEQFLRDPSAAPINWIRPRGARELLADPFGIERDGKLLILAERMRHGPSHGEIVLLDPVAAAQAPTLLLRTTIHASYPFVVSDGGATYVVPEQGAGGSVRFHRLIEADNCVRIEASPSAVIENLDAIDPTFLFFEHRWWLFCTRQSGRDPNATLFLFHSTRLFGPYQAHPANPIVTDLARARPAGRIIRDGRRLIRPAQDCSSTYGGAIVLNEITRLTTSGYEEHPVGRITPERLRGAWPDGTHQLDHTDSFVLIDSKRVRFHPFAWLIRLGMRVARARHAKRT